MTEEPATRGRPSIAERAARREALQRSERDRYSNLVRALQAGRELPLGTARGERMKWHPIAWTLVRLAILAVIVYAVGSVGYNFWRQQHVYAWAGPTADVTSGQRLAGCAAANGQDHGYLPTWVRHGDRTYVLTPRQRPLVNEGRVGETRQIETGYTLERFRVLIPAEVLDPAAPTHILLVQSPSFVAAIYQHAPECGP